MTTNTPWTPRPWTYDGQGCIMGTECCPKRRVPIGYMHEQVNAELTILAPEMAEALQELLRSYDATHGKLISGTTSFADAYFKARAILARLPQKGGEK